MDFSSILVEVGYNMMSSGLILYGMGRLAQILLSSPEPTEEEQGLLSSSPAIIVISQIPTEEERKTVNFKGINTKEYNDFKETIQKDLQKRVEAHRKLDEELDKGGKEKKVEAIPEKPKTTQYVDLTGGDDGSDTETQLLSQDC